MTTSRLDDYLEAEFTFIRTDQLAAVLAGMPRDLQDFVLEWTRRAAATNTELAFQFANRAKEALLDVEPEVVSAWTDGEVIYLPEIIARLDNRADNFKLFKAIATQLWAQTRYGTLNVNLMEFCGAFPDSERALAVFRSLETLRLDTRIAAELPGLFRRMRALSTLLDDASLSDDWQRAARDLARSEATVQDSLHWIGRLYAAGSPPQRCYQGGLNPRRPGPRDCAVSSATRPDCARVCA